MRSRTILLLAIVACTAPDPQRSATEVADELRAEAEAIVPESAPPRPRRTGPIAPQVLVDSMRALERAGRTDEAVALATTLSPAERRAAALVDALGMEVQSWDVPLVRATYAAVDSMQAGVLREEVRMRLAWLEGDSARAVAATRAYIVALEERDVPIADRADLFGEIAIRLGWKTGMPTQAALLRVLADAAPVRVTLHVAHVATRRWSLGADSATAAAYDQAMRDVLTIGWRAAGRYADAAAHRERVELTAAVAHTSPAAALERVPEIADSADRDRIRLAAAEALAPVRLGEAAAIGAGITTPQWRDEWRSTHARWLAMSRRERAALDSAQLIRNDTLRAATRGIAAAILHRREPSDPTLAILRGALETVRLAPFPHRGIPALPDPHRNLIEWAAPLLPASELAAWARSHDDPALRADAMRLVARVLEEIVRDAPHDAGVR